MTTKKKKILKIIGILIIAGFLIGGGTGLYLFFMPHRDVQNTPADFSISATQLVNEYLEDQEQANQKYLAEDGDSKILEVTGNIAKISEDFNGNKVVLLKDANQAAGVSATFTPETNKNTEGLSPGQTVTIKGVIRSGASFDEDLEMYEHVIIEKSDIVNK